MLLPSALSCDSSRPPVTRLQSSVFASPPASPPSLSPQNAIGNIFNTCRSLQSLLATPPQESMTATQLPTPPLTHAPPPLKLRLRPRAKTDGSNDHLTPRKKIVKRAPPRGANKRRRAADDDMGRDDIEAEENGDVDSDLEILTQPVAEQEQPLPSAPLTPKRARIAPEAMPLGLERSDYHALHLMNGGAQSDSLPNHEGTDVQVEADGEVWSTEDDRILVELVLDKLRLTKTEWQDCARSLGKDRNSLSRRWKSLMNHGDVGLKGRSSRRSKIHSTWR